MFRAAVPRCLMEGQADLGQMSCEPIWKKYLDIVTLFRYILPQSRIVIRAGLSSKGCGPICFWELGMAKRKSKRELVVAAGASPKMRRASRRDWTKVKEEIFCSTLAETCNVRCSAEAAGVSVAGAYKRRKENAAFRASWADAIAVAYQRLELVMLDRALNGTEKIVVRKDGSEERMREYPNQIAMHLLKMHRDSAMAVIEEPDARDTAEVRERLVEKLERLRKRFEAEEQQ